MTIEQNYEPADDTVLWQPPGPHPKGHAHRLVGPETTRHTRPHDDHRQVTIDITITDAQPRITRVEIAGHDIDSSTLRTIHLPEHVREALAGTIRLQLLWNGEPTATVDLDDLHDLDLPDYVVWMIGRLQGLDPTKHLADTAGIKRSAAAQRIRRARAAGHLPPIHGCTITPTDTTPSPDDCAC